MPYIQYIPKKKKHYLSTGDNPDHDYDAMMDEFGSRRYRNTSVAHLRNRLQNQIDVLRDMLEAGHYLISGDKLLPDTIVKIKLDIASKVIELLILETKDKR